MTENIQHNPNFKIETYNIPPTDLIPNSGWPLIVYREYYNFEDEDLSIKFFDLLLKNEWQPKWIYQYGNSQRSHYHPTSHEVMLVLSGEAKIKFGSGDLTSNINESLKKGKFELGGIILNAKKGDIFLLPAGLSHKTFNTKPLNSFKLLTPNGTKTMTLESKKKLKEIKEINKEKGFIMMGGYPFNFLPGKFSVGGEGALEFSKVWSIPKPNFDPILGNSILGLNYLWKGNNAFPITNTKINNENENETLPKDKLDYLIPFPEINSWRADLVNIDSLEEKI
ncbi:uncharacterized protein I206_103912 [Kwoniella pini CBS 10737]|uniref:Cupin type-1 domain-containing protein n=1 Tax=Kwoniella pini CBS 10737 TaxID=1296096 RepID=A0A1B9I396_9TREE|nr:uncharacterized protein I206_04515 [Kwoniella pini CBS 10737]OCF49984.1 hypothetical protein I206_04515 [Kwoniella pini CBS 10737]